MKNIINKTLSFFKNNSKKLLKLLLIIGSLIALSLVAFLILSAFGIVSYEGGDMVLNQELFESFRDSWYGWIIIILLQIVITTLLCFIPGASMAFIMLLTVLYPNHLSAFLIAFIGVMSSSCLMYITGRIGGYNVCKKLLGEEDCKKASDLLNNKGLIFFPLMMVFPIFPDDAIVMISGTLKMSLKWFIPSIVIGRGIGIATITFGLTSIPFDKFTTPWHWIGFILACALGICLVFFLAFKLNKYLQSKNSQPAEAVETVLSAADCCKETEHESISPEENSQTSTLPAEEAEESAAN